MIKKLLTALIVILLIAFVAFYFWPNRDATDTSPLLQNNPEQLPVGDADAEQQNSEVTFNKKLHSLTEPTSPWIIVNKLNQLPPDYKPTLVVPDVRLRLAATQEQMQISSTVKPDIERMFKAATDDGVSLVFGSGYRSSSLQAQFYNSYVAQDGKALADTYSARPGHSEHQTGLTVDITSPSGTCHLEICWEDTVEGTWLASNAHEYGFVIRYPEGKDSITGYQYEPWHIRHFGTETAMEIYNSGLTVEEFFELPAANNYTD